MIVDAFREKNYGILAGKEDSNEEVRRILSEFYKDKVNYRIPGGETSNELKERVLRGLEEILGSPYRTVGIVGHLYVNAIIIGHLLGMTLEQSLEIDQPNDCIYLVNIVNKTIQMTVTSSKWTGPGLMSRVWNII